MGQNYNAYPKWILPEKAIKVKGWVARDKNNRLFIHGTKPLLCTKYKDEIAFWYSGISLEIDENLFPEITCETEPVEVEMSIKKI